ncbi:helix-turn-helix transcriptional regulator [Virgibacillus sp. C22-A2]|uniref:Helix-turn-helix transcriptional regulator n=1 Tax=Virgibacillus tibetensis TaxID=3042313 RepID=A0ABU6KJW7_9BACI|nr:helix-turn-helix transcriptional regulator [Virgibacillus sp. C22-A2]MEC5425699.1 helix-turn-helix transcriptional regulator [Virgibacillus sp. C22-A2]
MITCGERLRELRKERGLSAKELGEIIGVNERVLTYYETNERQPRFDMLIKLADFFDVSMDYLFGRTDCRTVKRN